MRFIAFRSSDTGNELPQRAGARAGRTGASPLQHSDTDAR